MTEYTFTIPDSEERGIRVACDEHGESEEFQPEYQTVAFHCEQCGYELEVSVHNLLDWRDLSEMC